MPEKQGFYYFYYFVLTFGTLYLILKINFLKDKLVEEKYEEDNIKTFILLLFSSGFLFNFFISQGLRLYLIPLFLGVYLLKEKGMLLGCLISVGTIYFYNDIFIMFEPLLFSLVIYIFHFEDLENINYYIKSALVSAVLSSIYYYKFGLFEFLIALFFTVGILIYLNFFKQKISELKKQQNKFSETKIKEQSFDVFEKLNKEVNKQFNLDETYKNLVKIACKELDIEKGGIFLIDKSIGKLVLEYPNENLKEYKGLKIKPNFGLIGEFFTRGKIDIVSKDSIDKLTENEIIISDLLKEEKFENILLSNIVDDNESYATLFLLSNNSFDYKDKKIVQYLTNLAPLMIKKARVVENQEDLLKEHKQDINNLTTLQKTAEFLNSSLKLEEVFEISLEIILNNLNIDHTLLYLKENQEFLLKKCKSKQDKECDVQNKALAEEHLNIMKRNEDIYYQDTKYHSIIGLPIIIKNQIDGFLIAIKEFDEFSNPNFKFLETLSNQIATSIEKARMYKQMELTAIKDGLTGLYNHRYFQEELNKEIQKFENEEINSLSLIIMDIDDFKNFNDTYGHQAGDEVLKKLSNKLQNNLKENFTIARYGGEEFAVIMPNCNQKQSKEKAKKINQLIREIEIKYKDYDLTVTVSIGVTTYIKDVHQEEFIEQADKALYESKENGKDTFTFLKL